MNHFFSFLFQGIHNQTRQQLAVLLATFLSSFYTIYIMTFAPLIGVSLTTLLAPLIGVRMTSNLTTFLATLNVVQTQFIMTLTLHVIVRFEGRLLHFTTLNVLIQIQPRLFDTGGRLLGRHVGRLNTYTIIKFSFGRPEGPSRHDV